MAETEFFFPAAIARIKPEDDLTRARGWEMHWMHDIDREEGERKRSVRNSRNPQKGKDLDDDWRVNGPRIFVGVRGEVWEERL